MIEKALAGAFFIAPPASGVAGIEASGDTSTTGLAWGESDVREHAARTIERASETRESTRRAYSTGSRRRVDHVLGAARIANTQSVRKNDRSAWKSSIVRRVNDARRRPKEDVTDPRTPRSGAAGSRRPRSSRRPRTRRSSKATTRWTDLLFLAELFAAGDRVTMGTHSVVASLRALPMPAPRLCDHDDTARERGAPSPYAGQVTPQRGACESS